jgi:uncharacterized protein YdaU (DUF1376 family)
MKIRYVQLESESFLTDLDFTRMSAQERGVYCTILFYLYCNEGRCEFDPPTLARLCNCADFEKVWQSVEKKFQTHNGVIKHKRVSKELKRAKYLLQSQRKAGLASARKRLTTVATDVGTALQPRKGNENEKRSEVEREEKDITNTNSNTSNQSLSSSTSVRPFDCTQGGLRSPPAVRKALTTDAAHTAANGQIQALHFNETLVQIIRPRSQSDRTCFHNVTKWLQEGVAKGRFTNDVFGCALDYAKEARTCRNPAALFMTLLRKELGYPPKATGLLDGKMSH